MYVCIHLHICMLSDRVLAAAAERGRLLDLLKIHDDFSVRALTSHR